MRTTDVVMEVEIAMKYSWRMIIIAVLVIAWATFMAGVYYGRLSELDRCIYMERANVV